jgi:hypothetical protein
LNQLDVAKSLPGKKEENFPNSADLHIDVFFRISARRLYQATGSLSLSHTQNSAAQTSPVADWRLDYAIATVVLSFLLLCTKQPTVTARYSLREIPERLFPNDFAFFESKINHERAERPMALDSRKLLHNTFFLCGLSTTVAWDV